MPDIRGVLPAQSKAVSAEGNPARDAAGFD
jgi:hypothetical protein